MGRAGESHAVLAGVCSRLGGLFGCNTWVLRTGFVLLFMIKTLWALAVYAGLALAFLLIDRYRRPGQTLERKSMLESPRLTARSVRIEELDRRFREWERSRKP